MDEFLKTNVYLENYEIDAKYLEEQSIMPLLVPLGHITHHINVMMQNSSNIIVYYRERYVSDI